MEEAETASSFSNRRGSSMVSTPESFTYETKFVVLNFMSFNPHMSPPSQIYTPSSSSTPDLEHQPASRFGSTKSLPGTTELPGITDTMHHKPKRSVKKLKKMNTVDLGSAAHRHVGLARCESGKSPSLESDDLKRNEYQPKESPLVEMQPGQISGAFDVADLERYAQGGHSADSALRQRQTEKNDADLFKSISNEELSKSLSSKFKTSNGLGQQRHHKANKFQEMPLFKLHHSVDSLESSGSSRNQGELHTHCDADDEFEESNSSTFGSFSALVESPKENAEMPVQVSTLFPSHIGNDTPRTGIFSPMTDLMESAFTFENEGGLSNDTQAQTDGRGMSEMTGTEGENGSPEVKFGSSDAEQGKPEHRSEEETKTSDAVVSEESLVSLFNSGNEDVYASTSSVSLPSNTDDNNLPTASSSHEVSGICCTGPSKSLDRSKLRLEIRDNYNHEFCSPECELNAVVESMKVELEEEMTSLESEVVNAIKEKRISPVQSPFLIPLTPQTEAAKILARIGDEVKDKYEQRLETAVRELFCTEQATITYQRFKEVAENIVDENLPGWRQVALLLVYGQRAAWRAVETGHRGIGDFVENTCRLLSDNTAGFIMQQGGWGAIMNYDHSQSSDGSVQGTPESLRDVVSPLKQDIKSTLADNKSPSTERGGAESQREQDLLHPTVTAPPNLHYPLNGASFIKTPPADISGLNQESQSNPITDQIMQQTPQTQDLILNHSIQTEQTCAAMARQEFSADQTQPPVLDVSANNNHKYRREEIVPPYREFTVPIQFIPQEVLNQIYGIPNVPPEYNGFWDTFTSCYSVLFSLCTVYLFVSYLNAHNG